MYILIQIILSGVLICLVGEKLYGDQPLNQSFDEFVDAIIKAMAINLGIQEHLLRREK